MVESINLETSNDIKISSLEEGRMLLGEVVRLRSNLLSEMQDSSTDNNKWQELENRRYKLKQVRYVIQGQMENLVRQKHLNI